MRQYEYLIAVIALGLMCLVMVYLSRTRRAKRRDQKRPWHHYLLLWPIILDADQEKRNGRFLTAREWVGWAVLGLIIVLAVSFT